MHMLISNLMEMALLYTESIKIYQEYQANNLT